MKRYRLLKDTITKCGIVYKGTEVICDNNCNSYESYTSNREFKIWFNKDVVENNPEWFEEIIDLKLEDFNRAFLNKNGIYFILNKVLSDKQFNKLKDVIQEFIDEENNLTV